MPRLQLLHDPECPSVDLARARLRAALIRLGAPPIWAEASAAAAGRGSPTILIDGVDPFGEAAAVGGRCRLYGREGAPSEAALAEALAPAVAAIDGALVLIRHGETVGLSSIRLYGATDIALSELGEAQMRRVADALRDHAAARLIASSLSRSSRGAAIIGEALRSPPPLRIVDDLRERDFGAWEGWTVDEVAARDPAGYTAWTTQGLEFVFPGGEPRRALVARVAAAVAAAGDALFPPAAQSVAVLHKGIIKLVLAELLGLEWEVAHRLPIALGSIHLVERVGGRWRLSAQNVTWHLGELDIGG